MDDPFLKDIDNFDGLMSDLPPLPGGQGGMRGITPISQAGDGPHNTQRPASTVSFTSYGAGDAPLSSRSGAPGALQRQSSDAFSVGGTVRTGRRAGQTPVGNLSGGVSLAAASTLGGFASGSFGGGGGGSQNQQADLDISTNYRSEVGSAAPTTTGRQRRGPASIAPSVGYKSTAGGSQRATTVGGADSSVGVASWLDGGDAGGEMSGDDDPTTGDRDLTDFEDGVSLGDDLDEEEGHDDFLGNLGITPTVSTFSRKTRGVKRVNDERNLKAEEAALLSELESLEEDLSTYEAKRSSEELKLHAISRELDGKHDKKLNDIQSEKDSLAGKIDEVHSYLTTRLAKVQQETTQKLGTLEDEHREHETRRFNKLISELQQDIQALSKQNNDLEVKRELLKSNGIFTSEGIYVATTDAKTLQDKLASAVPLVTKFIVEKQNFLRDNVVQMVREETNKVVTELWDQRRRHSAEEAAQRRKTFAEFTQQSAKEFLVFSESRMVRRAEDVRKFHEQVRKSSDELRASSLARTLEIQQKVNDDLKSAAEEFAKKMEHSLEYHQEKTAAINANDDSIHSSQIEELHHRLEIDRRVLRKLFEDQRESTEISLRKATELSNNATRWFESRTKLVEEKQKCTLMSEQTAEHASNMFLNIDTRVRHQRTRNQYLEQRCNNADEKSALSQFLDDSEQLGSGESSAYKEEADLRYRITEREQIVSVLKQKVCSDLDQLNHDREKCQVSRDQLEKKMDDLLLEEHAAQLFHQSEISKIEVIRTHWEKSHMAQLHSSAALSPTKTGTHDASIESRTGFHPFLEGLVAVTEQIRAKLAEFKTKAGECRKTRDIRLGSQRREDEERVKHQEATSASWEDLFNNLVKMTLWTSDISERQVRVLTENEKLIIEKELLEHEKSRMRTEADQLRQKASEIEEESSEALKRHFDLKSKVHTMEEDRKIMSNEQNRLIDLQSHLRSRQEEIFEERKKMEDTRARLMAKKAALVSAGYSAKHDWSKLFNHKVPSRAQRVHASVAQDNKSPNGVNHKGGTKRETLDELLTKSSPTNVRRNIMHIDAPQTRDDSSSFSALNGHWSSFSAQTDTTKPQPSEVSSFTQLQKV